MFNTWWKRALSCTWQQCSWSLKVIPNETDAVIQWTHIKYLFCREDKNSPKINHNLELTVAKMGCNKLLE